MGAIAIVKLVAIALPLVVGGVTSILKLTRWGRNNKEALENVVDAVGQVRQQEGDVIDIIKIMAAKETTVDPAVVKTWKAAVDKVDPKQVVVKSKLKNK